MAGSPEDIDVSKSETWEKQVVTAEGDQVSVPVEVAQAMLGQAQTE